MAESVSALRVEQYIESLRQQAGIPGLSAAIVQDGTIAWERGFGLADIERNIEAGPDTPYPVLGLTAMFSAVEALQCVEEGRLAIGTRVVEFFPTIDDASTTLGQVLSHLTSRTRFVFDPGRYDAVAAGVKSCSGKTLRSALSEAILNRAGMMDSIPGHDFASWNPATLAQFSASTLSRYSSIMSRLAKSYRASGRGKPSPSTFAPTTGLTGATGLVSTAHDSAGFSWHSRGAGWWRPILSRLPGPLQSWPMGGRRPTDWDGSSRRTRASSWRGSSACNAMLTPRS